MMGDKDVIVYIYEYIRKSGFIYEWYDIVNVYFVLKIKLFIVLLGMSGIGKIKFV